MTRADIKPFIGRMMTDTDCAIRNAVNRQWPGANPRVHYNYLRFGPVIVDMPRSARRFIAAGERPKAKLRPFAFFIIFRDFYP